MQRWPDVWVYQKFPQTPWIFYILCHASIRNSRLLRDCTWLRYWKSFLLCLHVHMSQSTLTSVTLKPVNYQVLSSHFKTTSRRQKLGANLWLQVNFPYQFSRRFLCRWLNVLLKLMRFKFLISHTFREA